MRVIGGVLAAVLGASSLLGQSADVPLHNWTVPPFARSTTGEITTMTDVTPPRTFVGVQPCRVADTRGNGAPIQGGIFAGGDSRSWTVWGICGIPAGADAISVNFTVVSPAGTPLGAFLVAWPTGQAPPPTAVLTYGPGVTVISNAAIVPLNGSGQLTVNLSHPAHVILDVNGYFSDTLGSPANTLSLTTNSLSSVASFTNLSNSCTGACGVYAQINSAIAIAGFASSETAYTVGVFGESDSLSSNSAGVVGVGRTPPFNATSYAPSGVRGESDVIGVLGISNSNGVIGDLIRFGAPVARGILGFEVGGIYYGVYSALGSSAATGALYTVDPHPTDANKVIRYVALEGNEPGTYFRGRGQLQWGMARIPVPEDFRMVTDEEGLSVQITPIGPMATVSVVRYDLDEIVVQGSRDVQFFYLVQGIRRTHKNLRSPIGPGSEYVPASADAMMPLSLTEEQRRLLVQNGTYNPDGSVNRETAHRLGWDKVWERRTRPATQSAE